MPKSGTSLTAPATKNSSRFTAPRKSPQPMTIQPCARKCAHWNLRSKTHSLARYAGSPWGFSAKSSLCTTQTAGTFPSGRPSSAPLLVNVSQSSLPSTPNPTPEQHAGAISSSLSCMAITLAHVKVTQGAAKSYEWMVAQLGPLFGTTGHKVKRHRGLPLARV